MKNQISLYFLLVLCFLAIKVSAQVDSVKRLTPKDYLLWGDLTAESLSPDGKWVSYFYFSSGGKHNLNVKSTVGEQKLSFPNATMGAFIDNNTFIHLRADKVIELQNLSVGKIVYHNNITNFQIAAKTVVLEERDARGDQAISICDLKGNVLQRIEKINYYRLSPTKKQLAYTTFEDKAVLYILDIQDKIALTSIPVDSALEFDVIKWHNKGGSLLFVGRPAVSKNRDYTTIVFYEIQNKKKYQYDISLDSSYQGDRFINGPVLNTFAISEDHKRIFFYTKETKNVNSRMKSNEIQIWNAKDKELYPRQKVQDTLDFKLVEWTIQTGALKRIGDQENPRAILNGNQKFALVYDPNKNKPSLKQLPDLDYSLMDLQSGAVSPFVSGLPSTGLGKTISFSPNGKYVVYFKNQHWWLYSFEQKTTLNLTREISSSFSYNTRELGTFIFSFGFAGWTENDHTVMMYDEFDLWEFNTQTGEGKRLTFGKEENKIYRLNSSKPEDFGILDFKAHTVVPGKNLVLNVRYADNSKSGYSFIDKNRKVHTIVFDSLYVSGIKTSGENNFIYLQEKFNLPPQLVLKKPNENPKILVESNTHHKNYAWGRSKLVTYQNARGVELKGVLYFPANYAPKIIYPMIVSIYERQTSKLHQYKNPSLLNGSSLNVSNYTNNGYFVLLPDITYELGNPGFSALDCVTSAVQKVLSEYPISPKKLGLQGHSFGGYETDFIITQTNMFAAAIAGAAPTDLVSSYLRFDKWTSLPESWRFETFQMRMGLSLFDNYEGYLNNSPVRHAAKVTTPLMAYTGEEDNSVDPQQSREFYLALRRLKKEHILIVYPKEDHVISKPENQMDLTQRSEEWFGYYLKDQEKPKWMEPR